MSDPYYLISTQLSGVTAHVVDIIEALTLRVWGGGGGGGVLYIHFLQGLYKW